MPSSVFISYSLGLRSRHRTASATASRVHTPGRFFVLFRADCLRSGERADPVRVVREREDRVDGLYGAGNGEGEPVLAKDALTHYPMQIRRSPAGSKIPLSSRHPCSSALFPSHRPPACRTSHRTRENARKCWKAKVSDGTC